MSQLPHPNFRASRSRLRRWVAIRPLRCVRCHHLIRAGSLFTKGRHAGRSHGSPAPVCLGCEPVLIDMNQLDYYAAVARLPEQNTEAAL